MSWTVSVENNATRNGHGEVSFELLPGAGYKISQTQSVSRTSIVDDEITDNIMLRKFDIAESGTPTNLEISSTDLSSSSNTINISYTIDTDASTATLNTDYTVSSLTGTIDLTPSDSSKTLPITGVMDNIFEGVENEEIVIHFTTTNGLFSNGAGTITERYTISDSERAPEFAISDRVIPTTSLSIPSSEHIIRFDFETSLNSAVDISVSAELDDTATTAQSANFSLTSPSVTLASGSNTRTGTIQITIPTTATFTGEELIVLDFTATNALFSNRTNMQKVRISINDFPVVSIHDLPSTVTQGYSFGFELRALPVPGTEGLTVNLQLDDTKEGQVPIFFPRFLD